MFSRLTGATSLCGVLILVCTSFAGLSVQAQDSKAVVVKMTAEHVFVPKEITIRVGETVEWVNEDEGEIHEVTTDSDVASDPANVSIPDGAEPFDSHLIKSGKSFRHQFTVPGVYKYACPPHEHAGMVGQVTVKK